MSMLFEKTEIKGMELKNRLVRSATHEGMADENGFPTKDLFRLYERLAKGGVGLIITGLSYVSRDGKTDAMKGIDRDEYISNYRELADLVHKNGSRIAMQIVHGGRQTTEEWINTQPIAPSAVKENTLFVKPREMTEDDIERIIEAFGQAFNRESARQIKSKVNIPVFVVGGMIDPAVMEDVVEQGDADYISLSRALVNNPNFPNKIQEGSREPSKCVHCNLCLIRVVSEPLRCYHGIDK